MWIQEDGEVWLQAKSVFLEKVRKPKVLKQIRKKEVIMRRRRPRPRKMRQLVRDHCLDYLDENPGVSEEEAMAAIKDRMRADYGASPWIDILLMLVEVLLPLLIDLFSKEESDV